MKGWQVPSFRQQTCGDSRLRTFTHYTWPGMSSEEPFLIIAGPTAVGKTTFSLKLAERLNAEIISADSRQVYRGIEIGTAKPEDEELERVPHHFISELPLDEPFSAGQFADKANARIREILERNRTPLVVGGSTLYIQALQFGLADIPEVDPAVRKRMQRRLEREGKEALYRELQEVDPSSAEKADPTKTQRVLRALEVYHATGRPITYYHENQPTPPFTFRTIVLDRDRKELHGRIERRVDRMLERGLLEEVRSLRNQGFSETTRALKTIGYREAFRHLRGEIDYEEMVRLLKRNTRRYAKRQLSWFRRFDSYEWNYPPFSVDSLI